MEDDTRADIARRRLAALAADFDRRYGTELPHIELPGNGPSDTGGSAGEPANDVSGSQATVVPRPASYSDEPLPASRGRHAAHRPETRRRVRWSLTTWHVRVIMAVTAAAVVLIAGWVMTSRPDRSQAVPSATVSTESSADAESGDAADDEASGLIIDVAGKVKKPGIVELPAGSRVIDAIKAAGGAKPKADTTALNLARELNDGEQILVGVDQPAGDPGGGDTADAGQSGRRVNVNTASSEELQTLPGVGPATAQAIIDFRTDNGGFTNVDDLLDVKGIGPVTLEDLKDRVTV